MIGRCPRDAWKPLLTFARLLSGIRFLLFGFLGSYYMTRQPKKDMFFPGVTQQLFGHGSQTVSFGLNNKEA